ncbi:MAG: fatty acid hydroxylase family protein [Chromatiales bacterium]|nr:MAG: fatty acid hydroxylase family protein [Chromatiales bacterium]
MNLIALAVPFFLFALLVEFLIDRWRGTGYYRGNDAINSLSAGILSESTGYFTKFLQYTIWGLVLSNFALLDIQRSWFNASMEGVFLWVLAAVLWDFCYYWNHRFGHEISILWAAHAVHHQSEDYNLSTALRQTSSSFFFSWIFYLPLFLIGFPADVLITVSAVNLIYQFWVHTQQIRRLGMLDRIFVTPSNHRVHHAQNERYIDKNYGGIFVLWDRLFGTFTEESDDEPVVFGVRKPLANWNPFWANFQVYDYLLFDARNTRRWRDKIGIWFRRTGWRPDDVAAQFPKRPVNLDEFKKFDPKLSNSRRRYVLAQFFVALVTALFIADAFATKGAGVVLVPCLLLWTNLYTLGLLNEGRLYAARFELLRLFVIVPIGLYAIDPALIAVTLSSGLFVATYILVSALWLGKN